MKYSTLLLMSFISFWGISQPIFSSADIAFSIGDLFSGYAIDYMDPGPSGAEVTWDMSNALAGGDLTGVSIEPPSNFPNAFFYPNANVVVNDPASGQYYYDIDESMVSQVGIDIPSLMMTYSDAERLYEFPMTYLSEWEDDWSGTFTNGAEFTRAGTTSGVVDGYGTLVTPNGSFENVLRVKLTQDYSDTYDTGGIPFEIEYDVVNYQWFIAGYHYPVLVLNSTATSGVLIEVGIISEPSASAVSQMSFDRRNLDLWPNPASDQVTIGFEANSRDFFFQCVDLNSKLIQNDVFYKVNDSGEVILDTSSLESGSYLLSIVQSGQVHSKVLLIE